MFSDEILEEILIRDDVSNIPVEYRTEMIRAIYDVLKERGIYGI